MESSQEDIIDPKAADPADEQSVSESLQVLNDEYLSDSIIGMKTSLSTQTDMTSIFSLTSPQDQDKEDRQFGGRNNHPVAVSYLPSTDCGDLALERVGKVQNKMIHF